MLPLDFRFEVPGGGIRASMPGRAAVGTGTYRPSLVPVRSTYVVYVHVRTCHVVRYSACSVINACVVRIPYMAWASRTPQVPADGQRRAGRTGQDGTGAFIFTSQHPRRRCADG